MGSGASKISTQEEEVKAFYSDTPIHFSPSLISRLFDLPNGSDSSLPSSRRQSKLDDHIRERMAAELERLRTEGAVVQIEVESVLEKENLDHEREGVDSKCAALVQRDLEKISNTVERNRANRDDVRSKIGPTRQALVECYLGNSGRPLDCWLSLGNFRLAVAQGQNEFVQEVR